MMPDSSSSIIYVIAFLNCIILWGAVAFIAIGIYYMVVDRYICAGTDGDQLWLYSILVFTLPVGIQCILGGFINEDATFTRYNAIATVLLIFVTYGIITLFCGGVCDEQKQKGGLYT